MVEVNGGMVPPLGQRPQEPRTIRFERVRDDQGKKVELPIPSEWRKSDDGPRKGKFGDKPRYGKWPGGFVSVDPEPSPTEAKKPCKATIYLHLTLAGKGCSPTDVITTMQRMEEGAEKLGGTCPCPDPPEGQEHDKNEGRTVKIVIVWHPSASGGVATVTLDCGAKPPRHGRASSEDGTIEFDGNFAAAEGRSGASNASLCAHELGHLLFGTGPHAPEGWKDGHNPESGSLMRDTEGDGLKGEDHASIVEVCALCDKAGLELEHCCTYKRTAMPIVQIGRSVDAITLATNAHGS
ncbi:MAG: hypothetical protein HZB39_06490 [Planctomycetes bacterium]|nr:hypothetical protein [Planctomycetota bacterium]